MATCRSCGAVIVWLRTASGKSMPVDAASVTERLDAGTVLFDPVVGHVSHFATCIDADRFRRKKVQKHD